MTLVDSSVWVDHFRSRNDVLAGLLSNGLVLGHPFTIGELALGDLKDRNDTLTSLRNLPAATVAGDDEVLDFINRKGLNGAGIGYIDAHLLVSTLLSPNAILWTRDNRLARVAAQWVPLAIDGSVN
jgi:predicted nucleic acid-binding protein